VIALENEKDTPFSSKIKSDIMVLELREQRLRSAALAALWPALLRQAQW
jgi:hypothetical protein